MTQICCVIVQRDYSLWAERTRQQGHPEYADELTSLAREIVKQAVMIESRFRVQAA
jgi:hypothetical protein